ncbi:MAG TPA: nucleotide exchange factor GrpE [Solirubrobacteraceae bacterium]|jgi:molecular chaperone GrpE
MTDTEQTVEQTDTEVEVEAAPQDGAAPKDGAASHDGKTSDEQVPRGEIVDTPLPDEGTGEQDGPAEAQDELTGVKAQRDEYLALAQRTQADFENYRKRVARDSAAAQTRGVMSLARELLPALDNLDRALAAVAQDDSLLDGVRLLRSELSAALARVGIESFSPLGEAFDPALHEAMAQQPVEDADSGTVVEVYQPGYRLGESVIRPARVVVAA